MSPKKTALSYTLIAIATCPMALSACTGDDKAHTDKSSSPASTTLAPGTGDAFFPGENALPAVDFLPVEQAFRLSAELSNKEATFIWEIEPEYYLYKHQFHFAAGQAPIDNIVMNSGVVVNDEEYGEVEVFYHQAVIQLSLPADFSKGSLTVKSQGCADAGLCYPPQTITFDVDTTTATITPSS